MESLSEAEQIIGAGGERWAKSEILRLKGEIRHLQDGDADAEASIRQAIEVARTPGREAARAACGDEPRPYLAAAE